MDYDRRKYTRITVDIPAALSMIQVDAFHSGAIANLSMGGCFFPAENQLPLGAECNVSITVGEGILTESFDLKGLVVRSDQMGVGIKFIDKPVEQMSIIMRKISK
jgi:hypothetical protein